MCVLGGVIPHTSGALKKANALFSVSEVSLGSVWIQHHILYKKQNDQVISFQEIWQLAFLVILSTPGSCAKYL